MQTIEVQKQCAESIETFQRMLPVEWAARSILLSEGFAFCAMCDLFDIDTIIESGIYNGRSTLIWSKYREQKFDIFAIDKTLREEAAQLLVQSHNVIQIAGDGMIEVPKRIGFLPMRKVAVFLDGPKGSQAVHLAKKCLKDFPQVKFVGVHDCHNLTRGKENETRKLMRESDAFFFTDEEWFTDKFGFLDIDEGQLDEEQFANWKPGGYVYTNGKPERILGSYGPTIGFLK